MTVGPARNDEGFTLIEIMMAAGLSVLVMGLLATTLLVAQRVGNFTSGQSFSLDGARLTLQQVSRDFQGALGLEPCQAGDPLGDCAVLIAQSPTGQHQIVRYERVDNELRRSIGEPSAADPDTIEFPGHTVLSDRIANPQGTPMFSCQTQATYMRVRIDLIVQPIPDDAPTYHLRTSARPRNFLTGAAACV